MQASIELYEDLLEGIGLILDAWPDNSILDEDLEKPAAERKPRKIVDQHVPIWHGSGFRCENCVASVKPGTKKPCKKQPAALRDVLTQARQNKYILNLGWIEGSGHIPIVCCTKCGGFTTGAKKAPKLADVCPLRVSSELRKLRRGQVPGTNLTFKDVTDF